jgi:hypothetical protein
VRLWNADTGQPVGQPLTGQPVGPPRPGHTDEPFDEAFSVAFSPDGRRLRGSGA